MKVDFSAVLKDLDGEPIMRQSRVADAKSVPMTLANAACDALIVPDDKSDGAAKAKQYALAMQAHKGGEQDITPEDASIIKACIGKVFGPLVVGQAFELLNG